eukprot:489643_1
MKWKLGQNLNKKYPQYIYDTFHCFSKHKTQIRLYLHHLNQMKNKDMISLVMHDIEEGIKERESSDKTNLFRKTILDIFENVKNIWIRCANTMSGYGYSFSLLSLLTLIESYGIQQVIISVAWLKCAFNVDLKKWVSNVKEQYQQKRYKINPSKDDTHHLIVIDKL